MLPLQRLVRVVSRPFLHPTKQKSRISGGINGGTLGGSETNGLGASFLNYQRNNELHQYARRDSNPQPSVPKTDALSIELRAQKSVCIYPVRTYNSNNPLLA